MAFSPPVVGCLVKKGLQIGGHGHLGTPPGYAYERSTKPKIFWFQFRCSAMRFMRRLGHCSTGSRAVDLPIMSDYLFWAKLYTNPRRSEVAMIFDSVQRWPCFEQHALELQETLEKWNYKTATLEKTSNNIIYAHVPILDMHFNWRCLVIIFSPSVLEFFPMMVAFLEVGLY